MHRTTRLISLLISFVLMLAVGVSLASSASGTKKSATTTKKAPKPSAITTKSTAKASKRATPKKTNYILAAPEDLHGTLTLIGSSGKEVTLVGPNGVPYDFELTKKTEVELGGKRIAANDLSSQIHKQATIHFVPTKQGNLAESINLNAS